MKHLTKEINRTGRQIAIRVLDHVGFEITDHPKEAMNNYFINGIDNRPGYSGNKVAFKIIAKASTTHDGNEEFQMDDEVTKKIETFQQVTARRVIIVHVDTRTGYVSFNHYSALAGGYSWAGTNYPRHVNDRLQGPIQWNCVHIMTGAGEMNEKERDKLVELRTKNFAPKNQKSIFDRDAKN